MQRAQRSRNSRASIVRGAPRPCAIVIQIGRVCTIFLAEMHAVRAGRDRLAPVVVDENASASCRRPAATAVRFRGAGIGGAVTCSATARCLHPKAGARSTQSRSASTGYRPSCDRTRRKAALGSRRQPATRGKREIDRPGVFAVGLVARAPGERERERVVRLEPQSRKAASAASQSSAGAPSSAKRSWPRSPRQRDRRAASITAAPPLARAARSAGSCTDGRETIKSRRAPISAPSGKYATRGSARANRRVGRECARRLRSVRRPAARKRRD